MGNVYFTTDGTYVKIGYTNQEIQKRLQQLSTGSSKKLYILGYVLGDKETEKFLHLQFYKDKKNLEWFNDLSKNEKIILNKRRVIDGRYKHKKKCKYKK